MTRTRRTPRRPRDLNADRRATLARDVEVARRYLADAAEFLEMASDITEAGADPVFHATVCEVTVAVERLQGRVQAMMDRYGLHYTEPERPATDDEDEDEDEEATR